MGDNSSNFIKVGHVDNRSGDKWDEKGKTKIVQIFLSHGSCIASIQFQYAGENGTSILSDRHGENYGSKFDVVRLNYPSEYITRISGYEDLCTGVSSLTFGTNLGEYGPFGKDTKEYEKFSYEVGDGQFGGFHGRTSRVKSSLRSIGVYVKPNMNPNCCHVKRDKFVLTL